MCSNILVNGFQLFVFTTGLLGSAKATSFGCGIKPSRIIGGSEVTPYSIPWQVGLVHPGNIDPSDILCGGTLISDKHVLSAAHCMFDENDVALNASDVDVIVGEHDDTDDSDGTRHQLCFYKNHPNYDPSSTNYDFTVLHLEKPVQLGYRAIPACLPDLTFSGDALEGKYLTVSGWGDRDPDEYGADFPDTLHSVDLPIVSQHDCTKSFASIETIKITDAMICTGTHNGEIDACVGDSGGPLTYEKDGKTYVIGVVSFGAPSQSGRDCALPEYPGVFARVTKVLDWIQEQQKKTC